MFEARRIDPVPIVFLGLWQLFLIALKLEHQTDLSWWLVLSPIWFSFLVAILVVLVVWAVWVAFGP